jgi:predicted nucleotidyltransferase
VAGTASSEAESRRGALIARFAAACTDDERIIAAFVGGSVARGTADDHSDLDLCVVTTDDGFDDVFADRASIVRSLGRPLFLEVWGDEHPEVFAILDDGSVVEMFFVRQGDLPAAQVGAIIPVIDRHGVLAAVELPVRPVDRRDLVAATRDVLAWFWHDADHLTTALARGHAWWAYGQVEALRGHCVNVVRLRAGRPSEPEPYWKLDADLSTDPLEELRRTIVPIELPALSRAGRDLVVYFGRHGREAAATYDLEYPTELERIISSHLDELIAQLDEQRRADPQN